jgi:hypothetical protein
MPPPGGDATGSNVLGTHQTLINLAVKRGELAGGTT